MNFLPLLSTRTIIVSRQNLHERSKKQKVKQAKRTTQPNHELYLLQELRKLLILRQILISNLKTVYYSILQESKSMALFTLLINKS